MNNELTKCFIENERFMDAIQYQASISSYYNMFIIVVVCILLLFVILNYLTNNTDGTGVVLFASSIIGFFILIITGYEIYIALLNPDYWIIY